MNKNHPSNLSSHTEWILLRIHFATMPASESAAPSRTHCNTLQQATHLLPFIYQEGYLETLFVMTQCFFWAYLLWAALTHDTSQGSHWVGWNWMSLFHWHDFIITALNGWWPLYFYLFPTQMLTKKYRSIENGGFHGKSFLMSVCQVHFGDTQHDFLFQH